jgi:hypothetical protein
VGDLRENTIIVFVFDRNDTPIPGAILQIIEDGKPVTQTEVRSYRDSPARFHLTSDIDCLRIRALVSGAEPQEASVSAVAGVFTFQFAEIDVTDVSEAEKDQEPFFDTTDQASLVELLARMAYADPGGAVAFFRDLVNDAKIPPNFKRQLAQWTGSADRDAKTLITWAIGKGGNPLDPNGTTLGSLLQALYANLGLEDRRWTNELARKYNLYLPNE